MLKYFAKRILWMIPIVICVALLIFSLMRLIPGDPARMLVSRDATEEEYLNKRVELGLDEPFLTQLGKFLTDTFLHFDFGKSYMTKTSISRDIGPRMVRTMELGLLAAAFAMITGILLGITAATHVKKWQDSLCMIIALVGISMPAFWAALLLIMLFSVKLQLLPPSGIGGIQYYILPAISVGLYGTATFARQIRSSMLDVIGSDYVTTARSKGLTEREVIYKHALPNALIPTITIIGGFLGQMFGGSIVIETIFSIPGMGLYLITGINNRDYPVVQTCVILLSIIFCIAMLLVDLAYAMVDPRIKARYASSKVKRNK